MGCRNSVPKRDPSPIPGLRSSISTPSGRDQLSNPTIKRIFDVEVHNNNTDRSTTAVTNGSAGTSTAGVPSLTPLRQQGQLEITDESLIYRTRGRNPIIWPLRYLRQYGKGDGPAKDLFSFECGRHCTTGPGVFVFQCSETEQLFSLLVETINKTRTQQQTQLNHSSSQQSNISRTPHPSAAAPVTTPTTSSNGLHSQQSQQSTPHQQHHNNHHPHHSHHHLTSQHSESDSLREYVNIPAQPPALPVPNVNTGNGSAPRPRSSLEHPRAHFKISPSESSMAQSQELPERSGFDSATLPPRRATAACLPSHKPQSQPPLAQSSTQPAMPLYVNSQTFDSREGRRRGNSSSIDDVSASYCNGPFFQPRQLSKNESVSQSQKSFDSPPPNYIQLDHLSQAVATSSSSSSKSGSKNVVKPGGQRSNSNGFSSPTNQSTSPSSRQSPAGLAGTKSLSNLSRNGSLQRLNVSTGSTPATGSAGAGSSHSLNRSAGNAHQRQRSGHSPRTGNGSVFGTGSRPTQAKIITLDTPVPLPAAFSYAKIDFQKTQALTQVHHNRELAVNGNY